EGVAREAEPDRHALEGAGQVARLLGGGRVVAREDGEPGGAGAGDQVGRRARGAVLLGRQEGGDVLLVGIADVDLGDVDAHGVSARIMAWSSAWARPHKPADRARAPR